MVETHLPEPVIEAVDKVLDYIYSFEENVVPTVCLVPGFVRDQVQSLSDAVGFDVETLNMTLGLLLCYPLALIMLFLPFGKIRHLFSFLLGAFLLQFVIGTQWIHQLITSLVAYVMMLVLPPKYLTVVIPVFVMVYMTLGHLHRQYTNYLGYDLDFTGAQMVITQKLYMMAYNIYDGEQLAKGKDNRASKKCAQWALNKVPGIIEFLGYTFCFSNVLTGPASEFSSYAKACDGSMFFNPDGKPRGKIPSNVWPTLRPLIHSFLCLGFFVVVGAMFPILDPEDPQGSTPVVLQSDFLLKPWHIRYAYIWVGLLVTRQKYIFAWKNAEGANNLWYAGFDGFDDEGNALGWENCNNMDAFKFETAPNVQTLSKEWNKKTSLWLTRYVYYRTGGSLLAVYGLSAFWHGFYPGYYLFFLTVPLLTMCERIGKKKISPRFSKASWTPYDIVCRIVTSLFVEYSVIPFVLLGLDRSLDCWKSHYYFGHIGAILFYVVASQLPFPVNHFILLGVVDFKVPNVL